MQSNDPYRPDPNVDSGYRIYSSHEKFKAYKPLIGITGKAGSGKDSVGEVIAGWFGPEISICKFAQPLKRMLAAMLCVPMAKLEDREWRAQPLPELGGKSPLDLMLSLGTEWGREMVHEDVWVTLTHAQAWSAGVSGLLFTDVRFDNEAAWTKRQGGVIIETLLIENTAVDRSDGRAWHKSEAGIDRQYIDATVGARFGFLSNLQRHACDVLKELGCVPMRVPS